MNDQPELSTAVADPPPAQPLAKISPPAENHKPDARQLRVDQVGALLAGAYAGASTLKLTKKEVDELTADFDDEHVEIRPFDGIIYISHMSLRERLVKVFGPTEFAEIVRDRAMRGDTNEVMIDLVLMVRGHFVSEGIGTAKWYPNNPKTSYGDAIESAWSEAIRRCCKKIGVGTQVWRPAYVRQWIADNTTAFQGKWYRKDDPRAGGEPAKKTTGRTYKLRPENDRERASEATPAEEETDDIPF